MSFSIATNSTLWNIRAKTAKEAVNGFHALGFLPQMVHDNTDTDAVTQLHNAYLHGGGWRDFHGFEVFNTDSDEPLDWYIQYPEDPPYYPIAWAAINDDIVVVYPHSWVAVFDKDGNMRICRMD